MRKTEIKFIGHIVHCVDLDSRDEFNVEVLINDQLKDDDLYKACETAAAKNELVQLSGNSFEYEYIQPSGRVTTKVIIREEISPISPEAEKLLEQRHID